MTSAPRVLRLVLVLCAVGGAAAACRHAADRGGASEPPTASAPTPASASPAAQPAEPAQTSPPPAAEPATAAARPPAADHRADAAVPEPPAGTNADVAGGASPGGPTAGRPAATTGSPPPATGAGAGAGRLGAPKVPSVSGGGALVPPRTPGSSRFRVSGCLTAKGEADAQRFVKAPTRAGGAGEPAVTVQPVKGGAVVVHELTHACCLKAQVTSKADGDRYVVTEKLTGAACRCQCSSTIRTALALPPGTHALAVDLDHADGVKRVFEGQVAPR